MRKKIAKTKEQYYKKNLTFLFVYVDLFLKTTYIALINNYNYIWCFEKKNRNIQTKFIPLFLEMESNYLIVFIK